ncbi:Phosphatidic acid phosphatase type 2/haloperoxidase domain-containing protein [Caenorhabditis elegans]|uniref:Phosphatidic acid phosphatase type 2/haloperoxidase domain-containing protein n=1 Tax=Caenorhabditis elegans TaxID=6239 RepID=A0A238UKJ7_CAEEL|nr:Phosphatidic acid phosphatase type 2/haloperoxidase domain-containing protein [Caenorhabditis elegans]SNR22530.1 Phosphatidic acid phosphatase type 2/haloperoxidase domain-containing protein [Caenorhabditis elegans]|eukprot:NP_001342019.1 PhosphoLipid PhosPhatase homolog [Caenorhabditis elegans]
MSDNNTIRMSRVLCDFLVLTLIAIPLYVFHEFIPPVRRGFYCDDESIRYPFRDSKVTRQMLIVVGLLIPILLILATELFRTLAWEKKCETEFKTYHVRNHSVHRLVVRLYCFIGYFFVGVCFNQLMVDIAKYTIGRQRPHFMDVCRPDIGYQTCSQPDLYITDFKCTTTDTKKIHEAQLSFYSGHSAFSFYAAWFTSLYLQARLFRPLFSRLLLPVIQFLLFGGAAYVSLTRVSDYKHHWSDVLVGAIMGSAIGVFVALFVAEVFKRREIPSCGPSNEFGLIRMDRPDGVSNANGNGSNTVVSTQHVIVSEVDPANQRLVSSSSSALQPIFKLGPPRLPPGSARSNNGQLPSEPGAFKTELRVDPCIVVNMK